MVIPKKHTEAGALRNVWRAFNELRDFAVSLRMAQGRGIKFHRTAHGTVARLENLGGAAEVTESTGEMKRMQITSTANGDWLVCRAYNTAGDAIEGDPVNVAVPKYLRASYYVAPGQLGSFNYFTVTGEIRMGSTTSYLVKAMWPPYVVGQDIYAIKPPGKTDVVIPATMERVEWIDLNVEGRHLDTVPRLYSVCRLESGLPVTRAAFIEGGPVH